MVGADGFGYANDRGNWVKIPQIGRVIIGVAWRSIACTTGDRGALDDTVIGNGVIIDNPVPVAPRRDWRQYGGSGVIMAGSLKIGRYCMIGWSQRNQQAYGNMRQSDGCGHGYGDASHH